MPCPDVVRSVLFLTLAACAASAPPPPSPSPPPSLSPPPPPPLAAISDPACELLQLPSPRGTLSIPDATFAPASAVVVRAVCSCTRSGQSTHLTATFAPSEGTAVAHAGDPAIDACLQNTPIDHYPTFDLGSDCIDCGPKRFGIFRDSPPPPPPPSTKLTYSIVFVHP